MITLHDTAKAIDVEGCLHTGDLSSLDAAGRLRINGRKKDIFIVGDFNAYSAEIEGVLLDPPSGREDRDHRNSRRTT